MPSCRGPWPRGKTSHAGALSYGAAVAPRYTSRIQNVVVKRTFWTALSRLPGEGDLVGSGRTGLILPSDCSSTPPCPSRPSRPPHLAPPDQLGHRRKTTGRSPSAGEAQEKEQTDRRQHKQEYTANTSQKVRLGLHSAKKQVCTSPHSSTRPEKRGGSRVRQTPVRHRALPMDTAKTAALSTFSALSLPSPASTTTRTPPFVQDCAGIAPPPPLPPFTSETWMSTLDTVWNREGKIWAVQVGTGQDGAVWGSKGTYEALKGRREKYGTVPQIKSE